MQLTDEPELSPEQKAEEAIRAADDAVEWRQIPLAGDTGPFAYVTERVLRSESVGLQVRRRHRYVPIDETGERGYQHRGDDIEVETSDQDIWKRDSHIPQIFAEGDLPDPAVKVSPRAKQIIDRLEVQRP